MTGARSADAGHGLLLESGPSRPPAVVGPPRRAPRRHSRWRPLGAAAVAVVVGVFWIAAIGTPAVVASTPSAEVSGRPPVLAYYYIWFEPRSWERGKSDRPAVGSYSSDDAEVMRTHVRWAKRAGISGFIVSWKDTEKLNRRLDQLVRIASEEDFKLALIYQALDFVREPLPVERVALDLELFADRWARAEPFRIFERPLVIWSGTWKFNVGDIRHTVAPLRKRLMILASERTARDYKRLVGPPIDADELTPLERHLSPDDLARAAALPAVDGNAYYWSSANPDTFGGYQEKLADMGRVVHEHGGVWLAPVAPGFDARLIGGSTVVERKDGEMLRRQMDAALRSSPDAIGLISWNEFSENTHVEPSVNDADRYLRVVADIQGGKPPGAVDLDSSEPQGPPAGGGVERLVALGALLSLFVGAPIVVACRERRAAKAVPPDQPRRTRARQ